MSIPTSPIRLISFDNLSYTNLTDAEVENARFEDHSGISEDTKLDLKQRGAILNDSNGNHPKMLAPH
jgi:hypothetical protein